MAVGVAARAAARLLGHKSLLKAWPGIGKVRGATSVSRVTRTTGDKVEDFLRIAGRNPSGSSVRGRIRVPRNPAQFDRLTPAQQRALGGKRTRKQLESGPLPDDWNPGFAEADNDLWASPLVQAGGAAAGLGTFATFDIPDMMRDSEERRRDEGYNFTMNAVEAVRRQQQQEKERQLKAQNYQLLQRVDPRLAASLYAGTMLPEGSVAIGMGPDRGAMLNEMLNAMSGPQGGF